MSTSPFDWRVITVEDWAEIRRLYRSEKLSQAAIARQLALSRNTVAKALRSEAPPRYDPPRRVWRVLPLGRMGTWDRSHRGGIQTS